MGKPEERILALLQLTGSERVLDAGSGSGFHSLLMAEHLPKGSVVAVDVSREMLDKLRKNATRSGLNDRVEAVEADGFHLPFEGASFDCALSAAVWHHLDDPLAACREMVRTVKSGGRIVVSDLEIKNDEKAVAGLDGHDRGFGPHDMRRILSHSGLVDVEVESVGRWLLGSGRVS